jgi:class 3 adenylate cyclase
VLIVDLPVLADLAQRADAEVLRYFENAFLEELRSTVQRYDGTVANASHDELVAWFGTPSGHEDDPERAVLATLDLLTGSTPLSDELEHRYQLLQRPQMGVATGEVVTGALAADVQAGSTPLGSTVDLARGLAAAAAPGQLLIGDLTERLVRLAVHTELLPPLVLFAWCGPVRRAPRKSLRRGTSSCRRRYRRCAHCRR